MKPFTNSAKLALLLALSNQAYAFDSDICIELSSAALDPVEVISCETEIVTERYGLYMNQFRDVEKVKTIQISLPSSYAPIRAYSLQTDVERSFPNLGDQKTIFHEVYLTSQSNYTFKPEVREEIIGDQVVITLDSLPGEFLMFNAQINSTPNIGSPVPGAYGPTIQAFSY